MQDVAHLLALRESAAARGDQGLVREINAQLAREGYQETAVAPMERRPRGRPRKS